MNPPNDSMDPRAGDGAAWDDDADRAQGESAPASDSDSDQDLSPSDLLRRDVWLALGFLTRLPVPDALLPAACRDETGEAKAMPPLAVAVRAFPIAGLAVGVAGALALGLASGLGLHPLAAAASALGLAALVTGALHEDGLADVADGFGGGATVEEKKDIMRDSRIGTYGVLALVAAFTFRAGALAGLPSPGYAAFAFIGAMVMSRALLPAVMHLAAPARADGLFAAAGRPSREGALTAAVLGLLFGLLFLGFQATLAGAVLGAAAAYAVARVADRQIGGITGDVLGAIVVAGECAVLTVAAAVHG